MRLTLCSQDIFSDWTSHFQVQFALSSAPVFSRSDRSTDSEAFYASIIDLLEDEDEEEEVKELLEWWDR